MLHYQEGNLRLSTTGSVEEQPLGRSPAAMPETSPACFNVLLFGDALGGSCFGAKRQVCFLKDARLPVGWAGLWGCVATLGYYPSLQGWIIPCIGFASLANHAASPL